MHITKVWTTPSATISRRLEMTVVTFFIYVAVISGLAYAQECEPDEFQCDNGMCIPGVFVCDGDDDCQDASDEQRDCPPCPDDRFQCANGVCLNPRWVCDGDNDCGDGSDEADENGNCPQCPISMVDPLSYGNYVCDGNHDCRDASDEKLYCSLYPDNWWFQCANGACTYPEYVCDGDNDCGDGSDEADENGNCPECPASTFTCPNTGRCISKSSTCDSRNDCGDWSDETEDACPCTDDEIRCSSPGEDGTPGACIPPEWVCDEEGIRDCPNGDDEANCTVHSVDTSKHSQPHRIRLLHLKSKNAAKPKALNFTKSKKMSKSKPHLWYKQNKQMRKGKY